MTTIQISYTMPQLTRAMIAAHDCPECGESIIVDTCRLTFDDDTYTVHVGRVLPNRRGAGEGRVAQLERELAEVRAQLIVACAKYDDLRQERRGGQSSRMGLATAKPAHWWSKI